MPKITKLRLHLFKLFRENYWLLFSGHGALTSYTTQHNDKLYSLGDA